MSVAAVRIPPSQGERAPSASPTFCLEDFSFCNETDFDDFSLSREAFPRRCCCSRPAKHRTTPTNLAVHGTVCNSAIEGYTPRVCRD